MSTLMKAERVPEPVAAKVTGDTLSVDLAERAHNCGAPGVVPSAVAWNSEGTSEFRTWPQRSALA